jgi:hypothetical protein
MDIVDGVTPARVSVLTKTCINMHVGELERTDAAGRSISRERDGYSPWKRFSSNWQLESIK